MDYLITNGYPAAANKFATEANIQPGVTDLIGQESIQERKDIRIAIHAGDIKTAVEKINELNPQVSKQQTLLLLLLLLLLPIPIIIIAMIRPVSCTTPKTKGPIGMR